MEKALALLVGLERRLAGEGVAVAQTEGSGTRVSSLQQAEL